MFLSKILGAVNLYWAINNDTFDAEFFALETYCFAAHLKMSHFGVLEQKKIF